MPVSPAESVRGLPVRVFNACVKRARHRWMRMRAVRGAFVTVARVTQQLCRYHPPGEQSSCPACGATPLEYILPLAYSPPVAYGWRFGFVCGCRQCGLLFANPLQDEARLTEVYSPTGDWGRSRQNEQEPPVSRKRVEQLFAPVRADLDVLHPPAGSAVLDFGCGGGGMLDVLQEVGWETYGLDPATRVAFARHRELTAVPDVPRFDLVVLHHVLEHIRNPLLVLQQLARAMRTGGLMLIGVPDLEDAREHGELEYVLRSRIHVLAYSSDCLVSLMARAGLRTVASTRPAGSRRRVMLARRDDGTIAVPRRPLDAARAALNGYYDRFPERAEAFAGAPIRLRAALCNLRRGSRRSADDQAD